MANKKYLERDKMFEEYFNSLTDAVKGKILVDHYNRIQDSDKEEFWEFEYIAVVYQDGDKWICVDNRSGDCWVDEFESKEEALLSLDEDFEKDDPIVLNMLKVYLKKKMQLVTLSSYEISCYSRILKFIKDKDFRDEAWRIINE